MDAGLPDLGGAPGFGRLRLPSPSLPAPRARGHGAPGSCGCLGDWRGRCGDRSPTVVQPGGERHPAAVEISGREEAAVCTQLGWGVRASVAGSTAVGGGLGLGCLCGGVWWGRCVGGEGGPCITFREVAAASEVESRPAALTRGAWVLPARESEPPGSPCSIPRASPSMMPSRRTGR